MKIPLGADAGIRPSLYAGAMSDDFRSGETRTRVSWGVGIALGMGVGVAIGTAMDNMALGIALGIAVGVVFALAVGMVARGKRDRSGPGGRASDRGDTSAGGFIAGTGLKDRVDGDEPDGGSSPTDFGGVGDGGGGDGGS